MLVRQGVWLVWFWRVSVEILNCRAGGIDHEKVKESDPQTLLAQIDYEEVISTIWSVSLSAVSES